MKFLFFNVTVGCALFYLFGLGDVSNLRLPDSVRDNASSVRQELSEKFSRDDMQRLVEKLTPKAEEKTTPQQVAEPETAAEQMAEPQPQKTTAPPPPFPEAVQVAKHDPVPVPTPAAEPEPVRAPEIAQATPVPSEPDVLARADTTAMPDISAASSMDKVAERSKKLRQLVRDMERMADDKLLR